MDREGSVIDAAVFEEVLLSFLNFDDETIAVLSLTIDIKNSFAVNGRATKLFGVFEGEILNVMMGGQERIEEVDEQTFVQFGAEDAFEAKVGEEADIAVLKGIECHGLVLS